MRSCVPLKEKLQRLKLRVRERRESINLDGETGRVEKPSWRQTRVKDPSVISQALGASEPGWRIVAFKDVSIRRSLSSDASRNLVFPEDFTGSPRNSWMSRPPDYLLVRKETINK